MLKNFVTQLASITHLKRLRIHTRLPIVIPERITADFTNWISAIPLKPILVTQCNHPHEINDAVKQAMQGLTGAGVVLLNQWCYCKALTMMLKF